MGVVNSVARLVPFVLAVLMAVTVFCGGGKEKWEKRVKFANTRILSISPDLSALKLNQNLNYTTRQEQYLT